MAILESGAIICLTRRVRTAHGAHAHVFVALAAASELDDAQHYHSLQMTTKMAQCHFFLCAIKLIKQFVRTRPPRTRLGAGVFLEVFTRSPRPGLAVLFAGRVMLDSTPVCGRAVRPPAGAA